MIDVAAERSRLRRRLRIARQAIRSFRLERLSPFREAVAGWRLETNPNPMGWPFTIIGVFWSPYQDNPHVARKRWVPFAVDYWSVRLVVLGRQVWSWRRYANHYGYATRQRI